MLNRIIKEDNFTTFIQAKLIDIERMDNSKNGNPNFKLKFEYFDGEDARVMFVYTEDDYNVNNSICSNILGKLFNVTVFDEGAEYKYLSDWSESPKYKLSTLYSLS